MKYSKLFLCLFLLTTEIFGAGCTTKTKSADGYQGKNACDTAFDPSRVGVSKTFESTYDSQTGFYTNRIDSVDGDMEFATKITTYSFTVDQESTPYVTMEYHYECRPGEKNLTTMIQRSSDGMEKVYEFDDEGSSIEEVSTYKIGQVFTSNMSATLKVCSEDCPEEDPQIWQVNEEVVGIETIIVPAGTFDAVHIKATITSDGNDSSIRHQYYVYGIGLVYFTVEDGADSLISYTNLSAEMAGYHPASGGTPDTISQYLPTSNQTSTPDRSYLPNVILTPITLQGIGSSTQISDCPITLADVYATEELEGFCRADANSFYDCKITPEQIDDIILVVRLTSSEECSTFFLYNVKEDQVKTASGVSYGASFYGIQADNRWLVDRTIPALYIGNSTGISEIGFVYIIPSATVSQELLILIETNYLNSDDFESITQIISYSIILEP